ncbi:MAG: DNA-directed RNA polymerase subunit H [Thermoproteota archaeon]
MPQDFPSFNIFKHYLVPKHEILSLEERQALLEKYHIEPWKLPRIKASDPTVRLIGAKPGDIVKIIRRSPTAGESIYYRYVIEG